MSNFTAQACYDSNRIGTNIFKFQYVRETHHNMKQTTWIHLFWDSEWIKFIYSYIYLYIPVARAYAYRSNIWLRKIWRQHLEI